VVENSGNGVVSAYGPVSLTSSIVYWNTGAALGGHLAYFAICYSCIEGMKLEDWPSCGNINSNPSLCDGGSLRIGSPCIDAGDPGLEFRDGCIDNEETCSPYARGGTRNDMGAYGGPGVCYWTEPRAEPVIRIPPLDRIYFEGQPAMDVLATGADPLIYQWFRDGLPVPGQTNFILMPGDPALADVGHSYTVQVSNAVGTVTSNPSIPLRVAQLEARTDGLTDGRPRLLVRNGKTGERCAIYSLSPLALGETLVVPGTGGGQWLLRDTLTFPTNEVRWTDPQALGVGEARFYGVVPAQ
jgi:hypothetical protein